MFSISMAALIWIGIFICPTKKIRPILVVDREVILQVAYHLMKIDLRSSLTVL